MRTEGVRRNSHPGKFEGGLVVDEFIYSLAGTGCDDEAGDVSEGGLWVGLLRGPFRATGPFGDITPAAIEEHGINPTELRFLARQAGAIICEDDRGFVSVAWFTNKRVLARAWRRAERIACPDDELTRIEAE